MGIRSVRLDDALHIAELSSQLGYPAEVEHVRIFLGQITQDVAHSFFVADDGIGSILGWIHVFKTKILLSKKPREFTLYYSKFVMTTNRANHLSLA